MRGISFKGEAVPFVMELPNYRLPGARKCRAASVEKAKDFLERAFTVIFVATMVIWFLQTFYSRLNVVADSQDSLLAMIASVIAPVFEPVGFGDWKISTALITGFMAKEKCCIDSVGIVWFHRGSVSGYDTSGSSQLVGILFTVYTMRCSSFRGKEGIRRQMGNL